MLPTQLFPSILTLLCGGVPFLDIKFVMQDYNKYHVVVSCLVEVDGAE